MQQIEFDWGLRPAQRWDLLS